MPIVAFSREQESYDPKPHRATQARSLLATQRTAADSAPGQPGREIAGALRLFVSIMGDSSGSDRAASYCVTLRTACAFSRRCLDPWDNRGKCRRAVGDSDHSPEVGTAEFERRWAR